MVVQADIYQSGYSGIQADDIEAYLGVELSDIEKVEVNSIISSIEKYIAQQCGRQFNTALEYYEYFNLLSLEYLVHNYPISEVTKIEVEGVTKYVKDGLSNAYVLNTDFFAYNSYVAFDTALSASKYRRALKITYKISQFWGDDVKMAITQWASSFYKDKEHGGKEVKKFSFGGYSIEYAGAGVNNVAPPFVEAIILNYQKISI